MTWIPVERTLPLPGHPVLVCVAGSPGRTPRRILRAIHAAARTLQVSDDAENDNVDVDADGAAWCPPGWYEQNDYEDTNWRITDPVTHWMPLPPFLEAQQKIKCKIRFCSGCPRPWFVIDQIELGLTVMQDFDYEEEAKAYCLANGWEVVE